jgi:hypothetical protein
MFVNLSDQIESLCVCQIEKAVRQVFYVMFVKLVPLFYIMRLFSRSRLLLKNSPVLRTAQFILNRWTVQYC